LSIKFPLMAHDNPLCIRQSQTYGFRFLIRAILRQTGLSSGKLSRHSSTSEQDSISCSMRIAFSQVRFRSHRLFSRSRDANLSWSSRPLLPLAFFIVRIVRCKLFFIEDCEAFEFLAFEKFERSAAAGRNMAYPVFQAKYINRAGTIAAADDTGCPIVGSLGNR